MTTDEQVRRLVSLMKKGMPLCTAAVKSRMSEPTARKYHRAAKLPGQISAAHTWRTRPDPFDAVWPEAEPLLEQDAGLQAKTVFEELKRRHPRQFHNGQLRTLHGYFCSGGRCTTKNGKSTSPRVIILPSRRSRISRT